MPTLSRRQIFAACASALGGLAAAKAGVRWLRQPAAPPRAVPLAHLGPSSEAVITAAALVLIGPAGVAAHAAGRWDPAADTDALLGLLAPDQRQLVLVGVHLLQEWSWGASGFTDVDPEAQAAWLDGWRTSGLALHRGVWGFLHAAAASSFSGVDDGWARMGFPGPCVAGARGAGRSPGQAAAFVWDEVVP